MATDKKPELSCVDGIRVLAMVYIVATHAIEYTDWSLYKDTFKLKDALNVWHTIPTTKAHTVVETFFLLSGLLASYTTLKHTKAKLQNFEPQAYIWQRVVRLLPLMAVFILLTTLVPLAGNGPVWNQYMSDRFGTCYTNWWHNLLFLHNLIDAQNMCVGSTWFLSVDMQFHVLSLVVMAALLKKPSYGLIVNFALILASIAFVSTLIVVMDFTPGRVSTQIG
ncbi:unnamed protein product [Oppiella nova]|uniref:Acyltransferase 3 domain-containing protein n=1 Tax=Oppiella nova TaxID=334625 RepID=A0A7R9QS99_9ACAR|nr:unnamed protein product [Oppiella nova]CAG2173821.1 unnamed protein product [Oppiella nova]